jgi:NADPH:quinone reductase-like Zn-dependent oxidoreductase
MRAIVRRRYCPPEDIRVEEVPTPTPGEDEVLVKVHAASVNAADLDYLTGLPLITRLATGLFRPKSARLGLDVAGRVEAVGGEVTRFTPGDEVFGDLTEFGFGAFAEYACAPERAFAPKPRNLTFEQAATIPQAAVLGLQTIRSKGEVRPEEKVLINGAGGNVGVFAVQMAKEFGAEVTAVDGTTKLEMLKSIGADHVIDHTREDFTRNGKRYDRILDIAAYHSLADCRRSLTPEGIYTIVGGPIGQFFGAIILGLLVKMTGSRKKMGMGMWKPFREADVDFLTELIEAGRMVPHIDRTYSLDEVPEALQYQREGLVLGKLVVTM